MLSVIIFSGSHRQGDDAPPPRVIVFTDSEEAAVAASNPLRTALWGEHKLAVLLPHGDEPIKVSQIKWALHSSYPMSEQPYNLFVFMPSLQT